ncbi:hypothetical protein QL285_035791 [Trifolium repens]|nr:hypothetical protein QL285_035791 [Trifolium repens]
MSRILLYNGNAFDGCQGKICKRIEASRGSQFSQWLKLASSLSLHKCHWTVPRITNIIYYQPEATLESVIFPFEDHRPQKGNRTISHPMWDS